MEIIHLTAECYPVAKVGGLGDVVGALPKYQNKLGHVAKVVMPMHRKKFLYEHYWTVDFKGTAHIANRWFDFTIIKENTNVLGFDLFLVDINGLTDREQVYGYTDDTERFIAFQVAVCKWMLNWQHHPDIVHCHDFHTGFVPFILKYANEFSKLSNIATVLTIHNAQYQGWMGWEQRDLLPTFDLAQSGMLEWGGSINALASAIKCAWKVTTVSHSYLEELRISSKGLESLFNYERGKCVGILNGIDTEVWNPNTDKYLHDHYTLNDIAGKQENKNSLCYQYNLDANKPLIIYVGRFVEEKAADLLPDAISSCIFHQNGNVNFMVLGSGERSIESALSGMLHRFDGYYNVVLGYNESLSHQMYAAADFLLMPSRVEPCGLNQLYALRYGTIPMVRNTGGLKDTVNDFGNPHGYGITFNHANLEDINHAVGRAVQLFYNPPQKLEVIQNMIPLDYSWDKSAQLYIELYQSIL